MASMGIRALHGRWTDNTRAASSMNIGQRPHSYRFHTTAAQDATHTALEGDLLSIERSEARWIDQDAHNRSWLDSHPCPMQTVTITPPIRR